MFKQVRLNDAILKFYQRSQPIAFSNAETLYEDLILLRDQILMYGDLSEAQTNYLNEFIEKFDTTLTTTVIDVFGKWLDDGFLVSVIRDIINDEVVEARDGETKLSDRLDRDKQNNELEILRLQQKDDTIVAGLERKADQAFVDSQFSSIVSGAPKATYTDLLALQTAYPNGSDGIFLVLENGHWYYWQETTTAWTDGGVYQSSGGDWLQAMTEHNESWAI